MKNIVVEGHRGWAAAYPENTMASFKAALELGVDAIEFDVWLTSDKVPMLMHDGNALRTCGVNKHLRDMTYAEARELNACYSAKFGDKYAALGDDVKVPSLEELLIYCRENYPNVKLGVEIKEYTEENCDLTVALLKKYDFFDTCWFYAFNGRIIKYLKATYNGRTMGYPDFQMAEFDMDTYMHYEEIGLAMNIVKSEILPIYIKKGLPMHMFCADNEQDVRLCIDRGADLITANDPIPLMTVLGRI